MKVYGVFPSSLGIRLVCGAVCALYSDGVVRNVLCSTPRFGTLLTVRYGEDAKRFDRYVAVFLDMEGFELICLSPELVSIRIGGDGVFILCY